jgi:hypothetical protein
VFFWITRLQYADVVDDSIPSIEASPLPAAPLLPLLPDRASSSSPPRESHAAATRGADALRERTPATATTRIAPHKTDKRGRFRGLERSGDVGGVLHLHLSSRSISV